MIVFLDAEYKCHAKNDSSFMAVDVPFFDGKCSTFVEGYRYIPSGEEWVGADGFVFCGEMIFPWKNYSILQAAQDEYEKAQAEAEDMKAALALLGVTLDE